MFKLYKGLTQKLQLNFCYRRRNIPEFWQVDEILDCEVSFDRVEDFYESVNSSRIVIIDHLTTSFAELLVANVPFIILLNKNIKIKDNYLSVFNLLNKVGVVHYTVKSAIEHINKQYDNIYDWWKSNDVQNSIKITKVMFLGSRTDSLRTVISLINRR